jgi:glyoxylase-like metal-dependent hydrolase (beta-lactamase superfamily II)
MGLVIDEMPDLGITRISRWIFNCYVLQGRDGVVVVDAGLPRVAGDLAPVLDLLGGNLHVVVATHGHSDHVAGAAELATRYRAPIWLPAKTLTYLDGPKPRTPTPARAARIWPTLIDQPFDGVGAAGLVSGARVAGYGTPAGMRWTGPSPGGGLADGQALPGAPDWTVIDATPEIVDAVSAEATRKRLEELLVAHLLPGHGRPVHASETVWPQQRR